MTINFAPHSEAFAQNPYPVYEQLRSLEQPYYYPDADLWLLSRFDAVDAAARNPDMVRTTDSFLTPEQQLEEQVKANWHDMPHHERYVQFSLLDSDGAIHDRLRLLVMRHMSRRFVEQQRQKIEKFVAVRLEQLLDEGNIDFIADLACHIPGHIIGSVLGVPDEDCQQLRIWSENIVQFFDLDRSDDRKALAEEATTEFSVYLKGLIKSREQSPKADLISALMAERDKGELTEVELISTCMLILMAGHGSTIDVLGSGLLQLLENPDQLQQLKDAPDAMPTAVQEMFRIESPLPFFHRYAQRPVTVMGQEFPIGTRFGLLYGAANRDPQQFPEPNRFDINRNPNRHIAFGRGAHLCLGNHLSRIDMEVIFSMILARTSAIELLERPVYRRGLASRGLQSLKIQLHAK